MSIEKAYNSWAKQYDSNENNIPRLISFVFQKVKDS